MIARRLHCAGIPVTVISRAASSVGRLLDVTLRGFWKIAQNDVVVVDVFGARAFVYETLAILYGRFWRKRIVAILHSSLLPDEMKRRGLWMKWILALPHRVITPHLFLKERLESLGIRVDGCIPNMIEIENYHFRLRDRPHPRFLYVRSMNPLYNPMMAIRALAAIQRTIPEASLTMAGRDDPHAARCWALAEELGVKNLKYVGLVPNKDIPALIDEHDINIQTNRFDNMPVSIIEMWASGVPVLATAVGGVNYLVRDGQDALLVPTEDHESLAAAALRLLREPGLATRLAEEGRKRAKEFAWQQVMPLWREIFFGCRTRKAASLGPA